MIAVAPRLPRPGRTGLMPVRVLLGILALFFALAWLQRANLPAVSAEHGDVAANGLLVLQAKHGLLTIGNYSRLGFNHPGPALIDMLAAGEWLFHDVLGVASTPVAGQLLGVLLAAAAWLAAIAALLRRMVSGAWAGIAGAAIFLGLSAQLDGSMLVSSWFPNLYYLPFAAFFLATARLGGGHGDALRLLAVSLGVLVHGHAAFVPVCGITLALVLAANAAQARAGVAEACVLSTTFVRAHRRALLQALAIGAAFALPIAIETLRHWPGPVADYLAYGRGARRNGFGDAFAFVVSYWTRPRLLGPALVVGVAGALALLVRTGRSRAPLGDDAARARAALQGLATAIAVSIAVFVYAVLGVDDLEQRYVGIFYTAVPVSLVAWGAVALLTRLPGAAMARGVLPATAAVAMLLALAPLRAPPGNAGDYLRPGLPEAYLALRDLSPHPLVLDLDTGAGWSETWTGVAGLQVYAARRGEAGVLCIGHGWHRLFTKAGACTDEQRRKGRVLDVSAAPAASARPPLVTLGGIRFSDAAAATPR